MSPKGPGADRPLPKDPPPTGVYPSRYPVASEGTRTCAFPPAAPRACRLDHPPLLGERTHDLVEEQEGQTHDRPVGDAGVQHHRLGLVRVADVLPKGQGRETGLPT